MSCLKLFQRRSAHVSLAHSFSRFLILRVEQLEDRSVPDATIPFTPNAFGGGIFNPFPNFSGQVNVASGDINGDGVPDLITAEGAGPGSQSEVRIFDGASLKQNKAVLLADFFAYPGFSGGVNVAAADFNGDSFSDLITSTGPGGQGHVKVFDFRDPTTGQFLGNNPILEASFIAYPGFNGNVSVAALNQVGGSPLLITASGAGTTLADIRAFSDPFAIGSVPVGTVVPPVAQMFVFPGYLGGVSIATGQTAANANGTLFISPSVGNSVIAPFNLAAGTNGFVMTPYLPFQTGFTSTTDVRLGTGDVLGSGVDQVLASSVTPNGTTPISVFSFTNGVATAQTPLSNFQGFGFFGNAWLASSTFAGTTANNSIPGVTPQSLTGSSSLFAPTTTPGLLAIGSPDPTAVTPIEESSTTPPMNPPPPPPPNIAQTTPTSGQV